MCAAAARRRLSPSTAWARSCDGDSTAPIAARARTAPSSNYPAVRGPRRQRSSAALKIRGSSWPATRGWSSRWTRIFKLPGNTSSQGKLPFSRAVPAVLTTAKGPGLCFGDKQGVVTCLGLDGKVLWKTELKSGECATELQLVGAKDGGPILLAPCGSTLHAISPDGAICWSQHVNGSIRTRPTVFSHHGKSAVVFAAAELAAVSLDRGKLLWKRPLDLEISDSITVLPTGDNQSLLLYTGLWGNLYAVDTAGKPVWQAMFHSKCRAGRCFATSMATVTQEIFVTGYNEHLYEFSGRGTLLDDLRLSGRINASPAFIQPPGQARPDLLMVTAAEQAYRLRPGAIRSPYGKTGGPEGVSVKLVGPKAIVVDNPDGALLRVNLSCNTKQDGAVRRVRSPPVPNSSCRFPRARSVST